MGGWVWRWCWVASSVGESYYFGVASSNPAGGEILPEPQRRFIAQSLSCSPFHRLEMTEILLKGCKTLTHPSILLLWHMVRQGPAAIAAGAGWVGCVFFFFSSIVSSFSNASSHGRQLDILKYCGLGQYNTTVVVSYYQRGAC